MRLVTRHSLHVKEGKDIIDVAATVEGRFRATEVQWEVKNHNYTSLGGGTH